jgi:hypothetical protein
MNPMPSRKSDLRVTKTLEPNQPGAVRLTQQYGDALLCVRYRQDPMGLTRYTTVELIVDRVPVATKSMRVVGVRIGLGEEAVRIRARNAGARWDRDARLWRMPLSIACALGLTERVVEFGPKAHPAIRTS